MRRDARDPLTSRAWSVSRAGLGPVRLTAFARRHLGDAAAPLQLEVYPLRGGLESAGVFRVQVRSGSASSRRRTANFVVKRVSDRGRREVRAYETLLRRSTAMVAPRLLGADSMGPTTAYLYLEWMAPWLR
jgi:hypothetical protein